MRPDDRKYMKSHEWCKVEGDTASIGITDYAISHLSDLVFLDLPSTGSTVTADEAFGEIESVKAVSDLYSPVTGEVIAVNEELPDDLEMLAKDPFGAAWMMKVKFTGQSDNLMSASGYEEHLKSEED